MALAGLARLPRHERSEKVFCVLISSGLPSGTGGKSSAAFDA